MEKINIKQQEVINELDQNIVVLASAGTGKTGTLARRVANIIENKKANAKEILCISFTNKACKEMKDRIEAMVGPQSKDITVKTFHSWCFDIIKRQAKKQTDLFTDFMVYDEEDCKEVIKETLSLLPEFQSRIFKLDLVQQFINSVKEEIANVKIKEHGDLEVGKIIKDIYLTKMEKIDAICKGNAKEDQWHMKKAFRNHGKELVHTYNVILRENRGVDFNDLILNTLDIFENLEVVESFKSAYKYINIDEVQDTSVVEYFIIQKIFGDNKVLLCGDIFQTIYEWRGSAPEDILKHFKKHYTPKEIIFNTNYRATKNLVNLSINYLHNAFPEKSKELNLANLEIASPLQGDQVVFKVTHDITDEAAYIYQTIKDNEKLLGETCILTRDNYYNVELSKIIRGLQGPGDAFEFVLVDQFKFFRRQEVKDVIAFMKLIVNRNDAISLKRILKRFPLGIGDKTLDEIESQEYRQLGIKLTDFIDLNTRGLGDPFQLLIDALKDQNIIVYDVETTGVDPTEDQIIQIAAIRIDQYGNEIERFEKLLKNDKSVAGSFHIHGFSDETLAQRGEERLAVLKEFIEFSKDSVIVGHNVSFDIDILESELNKVGLGGHMFKAFYDTLDMYRRFYPNEKNHKLGYLSEKFDTKYKPTHDAMDDILATSELLMMVLKDKINPSSFKRMNKINKHLRAFEEISNLLEDLFAKVESMRPIEVVKTIVVDFGINKTYEADKVQHLHKFYFLMEEIDNKYKNNKDALLEVLKITGLSNGDIELLMLKNRKRIRIPIITVHQAKGLEFDTVFLAGAQENRFPSYRAVKDGNLEEEKRTFYVAITRAKERLYISSNTGGWNGRTYEKSRFLDLLGADVK
ncbi:MAG TPA: UvrD-helicase domain-containing protein [Epulopiscium sp.]|nr:UvrD-helicase domain-containing protein [Candidatus Epulonipiscium sp.]